MKKNSKTIAIVLISGLLSSTCLNAAFASPIIFTGQNAALFSGANPADTTALMSSVVKPNDPNAASNASLTSQSLILQSVESQISSNISTQIFNTSNIGTHTFALGDGSSITYTRPGSGGAGTVTITLVDTKGTSTVITVPDAS